MGRAAKASTKIKRQPKTLAQRMAEAVTAKGEAIGAPAIQIARGMHAIVDVPLRDAGRVVTEHTLINRGGTPVARWKAAKLLSDSQVAAIDHCEALWARLGGKALVMHPCRRTRNRQQRRGLRGRLCARLRGSRIYGDEPDDAG